MLLNTKSPLIGGSDLNDSYGRRFLPFFPDEVFCAWSGCRNKLNWLQKNNWCTFLYQVGYECKQPARLNAFLNCVRIQFSDQIKYLGAFLNASWWWYPETSEITVLHSKPALRYLCSVLSFSKKHSYFVPIACQQCMLNAYQLWSKYTQTGMKRLRVAYNNVYRIMH